jgi:lipoprotein NlpD
MGREARRVSAASTLPRCLLRTPTPRSCFKIVKAARLCGGGFLLVLIGACSTTPVNAPVMSRDNTSQMRPTSPAGPGAAQGSRYYLVRRGDTLYSIAWQNGLNFRQLAEMNAIAPPYTIYVGQRLCIAPTAAIASASLPESASRPGRSPEMRAATAPASPPKPVPRSRPVSPPGPTMPSTALRQSAPAPEPAARNGPQLPAVVSHWVWPTKGPLLHGYTPGATGKKGIDIGGKFGQPIVSAADGRVVYSGSGLVGYGRLIIIKHNDSVLSAYGHNSELLVTEGDYVRAGEVIGKMGSSGTSSARLYFEIRQDGKPVNPLRYLPHG